MNKNSAFALIAFLSFLAIAAGLVATFTTIDNHRLASNIGTLAREIDTNAATMASLTDRLIDLESKLTLRGKASYYGGHHHGRPTTSGRIFDKNALTAASPWLELGMKVRVSRPDTGASVVVEITDRGPAIKLGRAIDLSEAAARALGMIREGVIDVEIYLGV